MALWEGGLRNYFISAAIRLVFILPLFVLHHTALFIKFCLVNGAQKVSHPVAFEKQHLVERCRWNILEIVGAVVVGGAVQVGGADGFQCLEIILVVILASVEHQVFEQMGKSGPPRFLIF